MNLRNVGEYNIGLDLGTGSVGWAITDTDGNLLHFKGKPTWGSRIFPSALPAADARANRGQRRRYIRRRWRLNLLQRLFTEEMDAVDPEFFIRLSQSRLLAEDRAEGHADYRWPLFNASDFTEHDYYERFPTIYHLRAWLMTTPEKADLRLIYLAFHNIVKTRGNFLHQDNPSLSARNASMESALEHLVEVLRDWGEPRGLECECKPHPLQELLEGTGTSRAAKREAAKEHLQLIASLDSNFDSSQVAKMPKALAGAILGYKVDFALFFGEAEGSSLTLSDEEKVEEYRSLLSDEDTPLFDALCAAHSAYVLSGILSASGGEPINSAALQGVSGNTISFAKAREYERYKEDLKKLKELVRTYAPASYWSFFRGELYEDKSGYNPDKARGYTKYNLTRGSYGEFDEKKSTYKDTKRAPSYERLVEDVNKLLGTTAAVDDSRYIFMMDAFKEERFLRRLKTSDNGSIPYQLHLEEMDAIIENQGCFYPFLVEGRDKIESLVSFRIPYYVGPLTQKNAARVNGGRDDGKLRFAWPNRKEGKDKEPVYPWNWEEVIDKDKAAESFITRMTSECTYLLGEDVLPRCSLLYEEYCVLNELNGAHYNLGDGDDWRRFDYADRMGIIDELFKEKRNVKYQDVENWMRSRHAWPHVHVKGGQGEAKFESSLNSYRFFCKDVLHTDELPAQILPAIEHIILWNTLFEDRSILRSKLEQAFGENVEAPEGGLYLTDEQIQAICKKRFTGWGKLSHKLLCGIKAQSDDGLKSIMDVLREGNPKQSGRGVVFMEVLHDERLGFEQLIEKENKEALGGVGSLDAADLPGSPALRRAANQATRIVEEIVRIAGHAPANIFIENTHDDDDPKKKNKRTTRRYDHIKGALEAFKRENAELLDADVLRELGHCKPNELDERLSLYFMQGGKSLYSGIPLSIKRLSEYQVDHIIPQSYIKDDSFENKALVLADENQRKTNELLIEPAIRRQMSGYWRALHSAGLIGDKKFNNLMCTDISERRIKGFIARQLVETSQIVKLTCTILESRFPIPETRILGVKAGLSHELREAQGFVKCREINDFHHAHDALLAAEMGRFLLLRHSSAIDPDKRIGYAHVVRDFIRSQANEYKRTNRLGTSGFFVSSFMRSGFDKETGEIFKDTWDADVECERIRKYLNYKQVFISRMPEETSGAFWDATIYSPHAKKGGELAVKQGLDPAKYGGYSSQKFAFFYLYKGFKGKKPLLAFAGFPVSGIVKLRRNPQELYDAMEADAKKRKISNPTMIRKRILKYCLVEHGEDRYYLSALEFAKPAKQLAADQPLVAIAQCASLLAEGKQAELSAEDNALLYDYLAQRLPTLCSHNQYISVQEQLNQMRNAFLLLEEHDRAKILVGLMKYCSDDKTMTVNLAPLGGRSGSGKVRNGFLFSGKAPITFIDQSVTGMFERRTTIGGV